MSSILQTFCRNGLALIVVLATLERSTAQGLDDAGSPKDKNPAASKLEQFRFRHDDKMVIAVAFTPDGKSVVTCGWDNLARLWDVQTGQEMRKFQGHTGAVITLAVHPEGKMLATGSNDNTMALWDIASAKEIMRFQGHTGSISRTSFSPDGKNLASSSYDGTVRIWDTATGRELATCTGHKGTVYGLAYAPDGKTVISGASDAEVIIWEAATGKELRRFATGNAGVSTLAVSPDGKSIATGSNSIYLWEVATGKERWRTQPETNGRDGNSGQIWCLTFSPDGRSIASSSPDSTIRLWETATGKERKLVGKHDGGVAKVAFSPDGTLLASASHDKTGRLWVIGKEAETPARKEKLKPDELAVHWAALADDDASKAYQAMTTLRSDPNQTLVFLKKQIKPAERNAFKAGADQIAKLIADLDADDFTVREKASDELAKLGRQAGSALQKALTGELSTEARRHIEKLVETLTSPQMTPEDLRLIRVVEVLEGLGSTDSLEILRVLSKGAPEALGTQEASAALTRLTQRKPSK